ncbi:MAG: response regulator [Spirirestis rafaelensis WJT71-NPBG6]|jgi:PAS domain S-box-containing protein|nr:response regulator [Spirirestis rafaelensis WJT71-NPBG6]
MRKPLHVLIVEDSEDDMLVLLHILEQNNYDVIYLRVETSADMSAALDRQPWDVIICDYVIPGFGAPKALSLLKDKKLDIPFIIVSGTITEETAVTSLKAGASDFVLKERMVRLVPAIEREIREAHIRQKQRQTEAVLQQTEQQLRLALKTAKLGSWELNLQTNVLSASDQYKLNFGLSPDADFSYQTLMSRIHPEDQAWVQSAIKQAIANDTDYDVEYRNIWADNSIHWVLVRGRCIYDLVGNPLRMVGMSMDITERKRTEVEREELLRRSLAAQEQAETANRIKDEFLAVLSHELRTPLNPIIGWTTLLRSKKFDPERTDRALETIERNAKLQAKLINDLLDISRILRGKLSLTVMPVNLETVISSALETLQLAAQAKSLQIQTVNASSVGTVKGDEARLQQVISNLLSNAIKFTESGGIIQVNLTKVGKYGQIEIKDSGKGINPSFLPYVFEHFRQEDSATTRKFGGLGLGLAIARQIVELHGGTLIADSAGVGEGATFTVQIPLLQTSNEITSAKIAPQFKADLNGIKILVVDDEPDSREFLNFVLGEEKAIVTTVASGFDALELFERSIFDIVVSDIGMPGMDGYMLMRQLRRLTTQQGKSIKAIALTAYAGELDRQQAKEAGFQRHLAKPVEIGELVNAIATLMGRNLNSYIIR